MRVGVKKEKIENDNLDDFPKFLSDMYTSMSTALKKGVQFMFGTLQQKLTTLFSNF